MGEKEATNRTYANVSDELGDAPAAFVLAKMFVLEGKVCFWISLLICSHPA